jgi:hypothetical protein
VIAATAGESVGIVKPDFGPAAGTAKLLAGGGAKPPGVGLLLLGGAVFVHDGIAGVVSATGAISVFGVRAFEPNV